MKHFHCRSIVVNYAFQGWNLKQQPPVWSKTMLQIHVFKNAVMAQRRGEFHKVGMLEQLAAMKSELQAEVDQIQAERAEQAL